MWKSEPAGPQVLLQLLYSRVPAVLTSQVQLEFPGLESVNSTQVHSRAKIFNTSKPLSLFFTKDFEKKTKMLNVRIRKRGPFVIETYIGYRKVIVQFLSNQVMAHFHLSCVPYKKVRKVFRGCEMTSCPSSEPKIAISMELSVCFSMKLKDFAQSCMTVHFRHLID